MTKHPHNVKDAGDRPALCLGFNQPPEGIERFRDDLSDLRKRWYDRIVLERLSWSEAYLNGRLELLIYGDWGVASDKIAWACRIEGDAYVHEALNPETGIDAMHSHDCNCGDKQIMLIVVVEGMEGPQRVIRCVIRPHLIKKRFYSTGEGLLYLREDGGGYEVFPRLSHGEVDLGAGLDRSDYASAEMVQCAPEIMERVSHDERQRFWDWLYGAIDQPKWPDIARWPHIRLNPQGVQITRQGAGKLDKLINVAVGPLNL